MPAFIEVFDAAGRELRALEAARVTIGKAEGNDVVVGSDASVSRLHAALEPYGATWCIRDLGSRNGTFVNGERVISERALHHGDEIRIGATRLVFRASEAPAAELTAAVESAPDLTRREHDVLVALCGPLFKGAMFARPATIKEIAAALFLTEGAVKQHLSRLYDKFRIEGGGEPRPVQLANEAVRRGAVGIADVRASADE
jgi:DNA-binding transcriptional ArsR family regulator